MNISINFFRPEYFGLESFPVIEKIIQDLDVFVWNPQDTESESLPKKFPIGYFQNQWIRHNNQVTKDQLSELSFDYLPRDYSNYMWKFSYNRQALQNSLTEDIFVAGFILLKSNSDSNIYTTCVWPDHIPVILPLVDYIIISRKKKKLFRSVEESGLVAYADVMKELGEYFEYYSSDIPNLKILRQEQADLIGTKFNSLKIWKTTKEFGTGVWKDTFVNVKTE